jgi:hypothetical protein
LLLSVVWAWGASERALQNTQKGETAAEIYDSEASTVGQLPHTVGRCPGNSRADEARLRHVVEEA